MDDAPNAREPRRRRGVDERPGVVRVNRVGADRAKRARYAWDERRIEAAAEGDVDNRALELIAKPSGLREGEQAHVVPAPRELARQAQEEPLLAADVERQDDVRDPHGRRHDIILADRRARWRGKHPC
jgi:hypothetical protein